MDRRKFLCLTSGAVFSKSVYAQTAANKEEASLKFALSQYSLRELFFNKKLAPQDFAKFTQDEFGIRAIDLWEGGLDPKKIDTPSYLEALRKGADDIGSDLFLLMTGTFEVEASGKAKNLAQMETSINRAKLLGVRYLRIFLGAPKIESDKALLACAKALVSLADLAGKSGVVIVIEPGAYKYARNGKFLADLVDKVNHESCKLMPDFGKLRGDIYAGTEAMMPNSVSISCKMHSFNELGIQEDFDYKRLMKIIIDAKYSGYLAVEWEGRKLQPVAAVKASQKLIKSALEHWGKTIG